MAGSRARQARRRGRSRVPAPRATCPRPGTGRVLARHDRLDRGGRGAAVRVGRPRKQGVIVMDLVSNRQHIARWLQELIVEVGEEYTPKLALRHITVNDRQQEVASFAPQKLGDDEGVFGELVRRIGDAIDRDAEGLGGVQRYLLVATADDRVVARL